MQKMTFLCNKLSLPFKVSQILPACQHPILYQYRDKTTGKHWDPKWRKQRAAKVEKIDYPDYEEIRRDSQKSFEEMKSEWKRKGIIPPRTFSERAQVVSNTGAIFEEYVPPEGDGVASLLSAEGAKQSVKSITSHGQTFRHARKIKKYDPDFDAVQFSQEAQGIYMTAQELLQDVKANKDELHDITTEKAYADMTWQMDRVTLRWKFLESLEHPRVVHIRTTKLMRDDQIFAQVTVRMHTKQTLAIYDRFGRLTYGSEHAVRDCLEYIVMEKYLSDEYGRWRVHAKITPPWLDKPEGLLRTMRRPDVVEEFVTVTPESMKPKATDPESENTTEQPQLAAA